MRSPLLRFLSRRTRISLVAALLAASSLSSQQLATEKMWSIADTGVVRTIGIAVFNHLGHDLAGAAFQLNVQPWRINIPEDATPAWRALRIQLILALRGRLPEAADTSYRYLTIESVELRRDSLFAAFRLGILWRCRNGTGGGTSAGIRVRAWKHGKWWQMPVTETILHGDSLGCPR